MARTGDGKNLTALWFFLRGGRLSDTKRAFSLGQWIGVATIEVYAAETVLQGQVMMVVQDDAPAELRLNLLQPMCCLLPRCFWLTQVQPPTAIL